MKVITCLIVLFVGHTLAYHDPDLNYHLSQLQNTQPCDDNRGYSYAPPAVQLTTTGVKTQNVIAKPTNTYLPVPATATYQSSGYSTGVVYQADAQKATYTQPITYNNVVSHAYAPGAINQIQQTQKEVHGYATSAGLSAAGSSGRTVTPSATYAQAPIIAKLTAAPLFAKFSAPAKTTFVTQSLGSQSSFASGSQAKASLYKSVQHSGPVVTQVFAAPSAQYAVAPALQAQLQPKYTTPQLIQYRQPVAQVSSQAKAQYATSTIHVAQNSHYNGQVAQYSYSAPAVQQHYSAPVVQYSAPVVTHQYTVPKTQFSAVSHQYGAPASKQYLPPVVQHSSQTVHYSGAQYAAPAVTQYFAPAAEHLSHATHSAQHYGSVGHVSAPAVSLNAPAVSVSASGAHVAAPVVKNIHADFVENYDAHPRYAYEYRVHDPHTGDIKHQKEERDGEVVKGQYSLVEPDGSVRTVDYVADWETGFHAAVRNSRDNQH